MKTHLDCKQCFFRQACATAKLAGADEDQQEKILSILEKEFDSYSLLEKTPPEIARHVYGFVSKALDYEGDIYAELKERSNQLALSIYPNLKNKIMHSSDPLLTAAEMAIVGNLIDYGAKTNLNIDDEIQRILSQKNVIDNNKKKIFDYNEFKETIEKSSTILYLADNAGETVFDRILIEEIKKTYPDKKIIYAVKAKPIINDATIKDAQQSGINEIVEVVSSGSDAAGTVLSLCSDEFLNIYRNADMVISKGQGNFEALSNETRSIFFLFMIKCQLVAEEVNGTKGDLVLFFNNRVLSNKYASRL